MGEEQEEVGEFRVGQGITGGDEETAQFLAGSQGLTQASNVLGLRRKGPGLGTVWPRPPGRQEFLATFAKFPQEMGEQAACPGQGLLDPTSQLPGCGKAP